MIVPMREMMNYAGQRMTRRGINLNRKDDEREDTDLMRRFDISIMNGK